MKKQIQAAILSLAVLFPTGSAFAATHHHRHHATRYTTTTTYHHRHHYSQTRGALVGAAAGAIIDHRHPLTGAVLGGALGAGVQSVRNHNQ